MYYTINVFYFQNRKCSTEHGKGRDEKQAKNFEDDEDNKVKEIINFKFVCEVPCPK